MKKYLSVFGLFAQSSIYKILGIILLMILAETGLFAYAYSHNVIRRHRQI